ncbi:MAG: LPS-assembly protein LptD [Tannerella sp.]|nr:LPS-assembly protein LptD [Tannerella sp.]
MKRILLFILLLAGTGCKVIQPPAGKADTQPESSPGKNQEEVLHPQTDTNIPDVKTDQTYTTDSIATEGEHPAFYGSDAPNDHLPADSITVQLDSSLIQANTADSVPKKKGALEATVDYQARDSIVMTAGNIVFLYGEGDVKYQDIALKSEFIQMKVDSNLLYATHGVDSLGEEFGHPVFSEGDQELEAKEMSYNFKTQKAHARHIVTKQGEGFVISRQAKKMEDDIMYLENGKYTTCDHPEPHFYINLTKGKVRTGKDIVTGPAYLVIEDVPLFPLVLPFAFFPFTDSYSSGILMPSYGEEMNRGFFLRDGGYYFALSDYFDLALTGELYTKGSWGLGAKSSYRKRYKYSGNFELSRITTVTGEKGLDDYSKGNDFKIRWSHSQDAKANPYRTISASIDYSSSRYNKNNLNSMYGPAGTENNKSSSVSLSQRFPNKPFSISASMNINQRSKDSTVSVSLPDLSLNLSRIYPFKRKNVIGKERWYEKISMSYTGRLRNNISTKEDKLFNSNLIKDWNNGMTHAIPISATYTLLDYINISPSFNYNEEWLTRKVTQGFDPVANRMTPTDTTYGFYRVYDYSASLSASTTIYGIFTPIKPLQKYVSVIRHRFEPSVSFSARPDFGDPKYGFYNYYDIHDYTDPSRPIGEYYTAEGYYSPYSKAAPRGKSGSLSFTVNNNIEAKVPDEEEESGYRKISIIDNLSGSMSYNLAADSCKWSDLNASIRLKITKSYTLNLSAVFDTYTYGYNETTKQAYRIDKPRWTVGKGFGRLRSTGTSFSYTFNNDTFKKWFGRSDEQKKKRSSGVDDMLGPDEYDPNDPYEEEETEAPNNEKGSMLNRKKKTEGEYDEDGYYNATIPWSLSFSYNLSIAYSTFNADKMEYDRKLTHAFSFNGNLQPTKNWRITFSGTYDFDFNKIVGVRGSISRSMHCFQMSASIIPMGNYKSYSFSISANSSMLKDLKYDQSSTPRTGQTWY